MESETKYGLRRHNTYDQVVAYIKADPTTIKFPNRAALFLEAHPIYGQLKDSMRTYSEGRQAQAIYEQGGNAAPFEPPRPRMQPPLVMAQTCHRQRMMMTCCLHRLTSQGT